MANVRDRIQITIEYMKVGDTQWRKLSLEADEYFDISPDDPDDEEITLRSVPMYNHGIDYLELEPREARVVRLVLEDSLDGSSRTITETFWGDGECCAMERVDTGRDPYWELIIETRIADQPPTWDILRLMRKEGILVPVYHGIIRDNPDGSQTESLIVLETRHGTISGTPPTS